VEIAAISDRLVYAEETLKSFTETESVLAKRERIKREIENRKQDGRLIAAELDRLELEVVELATMKHLVADGLKEMKKNKADPVEAENPVKKKE